MRKTIISLSCLLLAGMIYAQEPVRIECRTGEGIGKNIHLWRVEKGEEKNMVNAGYNGNGYYGFSFIPEYEGFYVIGDDKLYHYPLYLKPGDQVSLYMDKDTVYLTGKHNSRENKVLYEWVNLSKDVCEKAMYFQRRRSTFEDFFPDFEKLLAQTEAFKAGIKTKNPKFNALMKRSVDFELDLYALNFLYTPRSKHPSKEQRIAYYNILIRPNKFTDTVILEMPYGMGLLNKYAMHNGLENNIDYNNLKAFLSVIPNKTLQGEMVVKRGRDFGRSYYEYLQFLEQAKPLVTTEQWALLEEKASKLYEAKKGEQAIDFTYPDAEGKMHSLSDYKGKVVVVDVWATWCGPCKGELPHLKTLEKEMEGTDVVFIGVSVDKEKDLEKWKKFIVDEQLPGVQLFAGGWSKITQDYKITGIPRFMVFGKDGSIVESNAPRPSNPALKKMLEAELKK